MSGIWGKHIKYNIFGESHGKAIGIVIEGLPPGICIDWNQIELEMNRRRPGKGSFATTRKETDQVEILSGYFQGKTTGTPLCAVIFNTDKKSKDYDAIKNTIRPGHADYTAYVKYDGFNDYRGGGHFSGRLTAPIVFAGAIAKQLLQKSGIFVGAHIYQIGNVHDQPFDPVSLNVELIEALKNKEFSVIDEQKENQMKKLISEVKEESNSIGGVIEVGAVQLSAGLGGPMFESVESALASILFGIPAVKGIEFGSGFHIARMKGSQANDLFTIDDQGHIKTITNHNGGILGGITNGMPLICRVAFKPTPSIGKPQKTVNIETGNMEEIQIQGRHDPCIVPRAIPVVEGAVAMTILDLLLSYQKHKKIK
jgi:chorismate synthase